MCDANFFMCKQDNDLIYMHGIKELLQVVQEQNPEKSTKIGGVYHALWYHREEYR